MSISSSIMAIEELYANALLDARRHYRDTQEWLEWVAEEEKPIIANTKGGLFKRLSKGKTWEVADIRVTKEDGRIWYEWCLANKPANDVIALGAWRLRGLQGGVPYGLMRKFTGGYDEDFNPIGEPVYQDDLPVMVGEEELDWLENLGGGWLRKDALLEAMPDIVDETGQTPATDYTDVVLIYNQSPRLFYGDYVVDNT